MTATIENTNPMNNSDDNKNNLASAPVVVDRGVVPLPHEEIEAERYRLAQLAWDTLEHSKASNTRKQYKRQWEKFCGWALERGYEVEPASVESVLAYVQHLHSDRGLKPGSIRLAVSSIRDAHERNRLESPTIHHTVKAQLSAVRRQQARQAGRSMVEKARPLTVPELKRMLEATEDDLRGLRDAALLSLGFFSGLRVEELASLKKDQLSVGSELQIRLGATKGDQTGKGALVCVAFAEDGEVCPVRLVQRWLDASAEVEGPLFFRLTKNGRYYRTPTHLSMTAVQNILKKRATAADVDTSRLSIHSFRRGIAHAALAAGKDIQGVRLHLRHQNISTTSNYLDEVAPMLEKVTKGVA